MKVQYEPQSMRGGRESPFPSAEKMETRFPPRTAGTRRTKIIATIGPATESETVLARLIGCVDVIRLNMAHATHDWARQIVRRIRRASSSTGRDVAVMMDIKGPEIRTGDLPAPVELRFGEAVDIVARPDRYSGRKVRSVGTNYPDLADGVSVGDAILVDNGLIRLEVLAKNDAWVRCRVIVPGQLGSRRHINLPGIKVNLPAFTEKDRADVTVAVEEGVDFIAQSFVRQAADVRQLREFLRGLNSSAQVVAKIEDRSAIANLEEIVEAADALMVARGDLGIECPYEDLPVIQRRAVDACLARGRPVIIATHLLESMITQAIPTRAEISDVANAVGERVDCVMLSGETATGRHPLECIAVLDKVARRMEREDIGDRPPPTVFTDERMKILNAAVVLANGIPGSRVLAFTRRGFIARGLAMLRPTHAPIFAFTPFLTVARHLRLVRAVEPFVMPFAIDPNATIENAIRVLVQQGAARVGDKIVVATDIVAEDRVVDSIQLRTAR